jgi:beta-glucosidase
MIARSVVAAEKAESPFSQLPDNLLYDEMMIGYANSDFQANGPDVCGDSNWSAAADAGKVPPAGKSIEHAAKFAADIKIMADQGINSYRFSIEWSDIEREPNVWNDVAIARYKKMLDICLANGITPMLTLLHFTEPAWFTKLGGFEDENNIGFFVKFARKVFEEFSPKVRLWCTINEPGIQAFQGHFNGEFPPFNHTSPQKTVDLLTNLLKAHVKVYEALKQMPNGKEAQIGIVHNLLKFKSNSSWNPFTNSLANTLTELASNIVMKFLKTGKIALNWYTAKKEYEDTSAPACFDFLGLNFYSFPMIGFGLKIKNYFGPTCAPGQELSDMFVPIAPEDLAQAIDEVAEVAGERPIYITEAGVCDNDLEKGKDDTRRQKYLQGYLQVFINKLAEGVKLKGLYYWTFIKNYEWNQGYTKDFGLFSQDRKPRGKSTNLYTQFLQLFKGKREEQAALKSNVLRA